MERLVSLCATLLFLGVTAMTLCGQNRAGSHSGIDSIRDQFVGAWQLAWLEEQGADGKTHRADCSGLLVYTPDGHMSVQVMYRNPPATSQASSQKATNAAPVQYAQGGYEASFGTYEINEDGHTFIYHVDGALVRTLIGKDLSRAFEFSGNQLIVKSTHADEHWRVAWEHYRTDPSRK